MAEQEINVLNLKVDAKQAIASMGEIEKKLEAVKKRQEEIEQATQKTDKELKVSDEEYATNAETIKVLNQQMAAYRKQLQNQVKTQLENDGSLKAMRASLSNLTAEYDSLTETARNGDIGKNMAKSITDLSNKIKEAEASTNRFYRNVGNYSQSIQDAFAQTNMGKWFGIMKTGMDTLGGDALKSGSAVQKAGGMMKNALSGIGTALKALLANPILLVIAGIVAAITTLVKAMNNSEERMEALRVAAAPLQMALDLVKNAISKLADGLVVLISGISSAVSWFTDLIGVTNGAGAASSEYQKQIKEEIALEHERRNQKVANSKKDLQIAQLRDQEARTDRKNFKERRRLLQTAINLEQQKSDKELELTTREYELAKKQAARADNDKEANDKLAEAEAKLYEVRTRHLQDTRRLQLQITTLQEEETKAEEERQKKEKEARDKATQEAQKQLEKRKQMYEKQIAEQRKAIDLTIALIKDENERQMKALAENHKREIADLQKRLKTEKDLTVGARKAINQQIILLNEKYQRDIEDLNASRLNKELAQEKYNNELRLAALEAGSDKELALKLKNLELERDMELKNTELTAEQKKLIRAKYEKQMTDLQLADIKKRQEETAKLTELAAKNEIMKLQVSGASELQILEEKAKQAADIFANMTKKQGETDEAYQNRLLVAQQNAIESEKAVTDKKKSMQEAQVQGYQDVATSIVGVANAVMASAGADEEAKKVSAVLGIVTSGVALAKGIEKSMEEPWPANLAALASTVASIMPIIANVKTLAGYSTGGYVSGAGSGTSDSVPARLSNGESVMNARATAAYAPLLSSLNQSMGGAPITAGQSVSDNNYLANQMLMAMNNLHPVVSVVDINRGQNRVSVVQQNSKIL